MKHTFYREQQLNTDIETAWSFFSSAKNLSKITPKNMNFRVLSKFKDDHIFKGMIINYTVSPLLRIPLKWRTKITQVEELKSFTDFQKNGPYKLWNHHHEFVENENGVLMKDTVEYELPFGFIGDFLHQILVKKKIKDIFDYRYQWIDENLNS